MERIGKALEVTLFKTEGKTQVLNCANLSINHKKLFLKNLLEELKPEAAFFSLNQGVTSSEKMKIQKTTAKTLIKISAGK